MSKEGSLDGRCCEARGETRTSVNELAQHAEAPAPSLNTAYPIAPRGCVMIASSRQIDTNVCRRVRSAAFCSGTGEIAASSTIRNAPGSVFEWVVFIDSYQFDTRNEKYVIEFHPGLKNALSRT